MTLTSAIVGFAAVAAVLTVIPGLDTTLVLRSALTQSRRHAIVTALGISTGALVWGAAAAVGAAALLAASEVAYRILTIAGAAYMAYLGVMLIVRSFRRPAEGPSPTVPTSLWRAYFGGAAFARRWLANARALRVVDRIAGTVLIAFGARLALERH